MRKTLTKMKILFNEKEVTEDTVIRKELKGFELNK